jgi:hypothetical protein
MPKESLPERDWEKEFVEKGANLEHDRWARWQKHMFSKGTIVKVGLHEGDLIIPAEFVDRWFRQIDTTYADLSEPEKESDRKETRNYLPLIKDIESSADQRGREEGYFLAARHARYEVKEEMLNCSATKDAQLVAMILRKLQTRLAKYRIK